MGQLHDRMAQDLVLRNLSPATARNYLLYGRKFATHYGLMAGVNVSTKLEQCRRLLGMDETAPKARPQPTWIERLVAWTGQDPLRCAPAGRGGSANFRTRNCCWRAVAVEACKVADRVIAVVQPVEPVRQKSRKADVRLLFGEEEARGRQA
jgi:hypothetical protein